MAMVDKLRMAPVSQKLYTKTVSDLGEAVSSELQQLNIGRKIRGKNIAITGGSRGVARIPEVLFHIARFVEESGGKPFLFAAMGSHGGATIKGQKLMLDGLGVTENSVGAPMRITNDVEQIDTANDYPVFIDKEAVGADGIIVVNRVKHHTDLTGKQESGLFKMIAVGMGKRPGADMVHSDGLRSMAQLIPTFANSALKNLPILGGLGVIENGYHNVARIAGAKPTQFALAEQEMLRFWKRIRPQIPFDDIDVLIVEQMGKDISGAGMDTKTIGRLMVAGAAEPKRPYVRIILPLDLTPGSHGNAAGLGLANVTTKRLMRKVNEEHTTLNIMTSGLMERLKTPRVEKTEREALDWALKAAKVRKVEQARVVRIRDTNSLWQLHASEALLTNVARNRKLEMAGSLETVSFRGDGRLMPVNYD